MPEIVKDKHRDYVTLDLLAFESATTFLLEPGVTTATFFKSASFEQATHSLRARYFDVLKANPWLCGRLTKDKGKKRVQLVYPKTVTNSDLDELFHDNENITVDQNSNYETIYKNITKNKRVYIQTGLKLKNKDKPLASLTIIKSHNDEFVVIFSLSHIIGDGATYYSILNMICSNDEITALNPKRNQSYTTEAAVGKADSRFLASKAKIFNALFGWVFGPKSSVFAYNIDKEAIQATKIKFTPSASIPFISTNDIVCSAFMRATKPRLCLMAINFRSRYPGLTNNDAGNYEGVMFYDKGIYNSPENIRKSLQGNLPYKTRTKPFPGVTETLRMNCAIISNWSSFAINFVVDDTQFDLHIPILPTKLPSDTMIIFKSRPNTTALLVLSKWHKRDYFTDNDKNALYQYLDQPVSDMIFTY